MITKSQHVKIWEEIRRLRNYGLEVMTAEGDRVVSCTIETNGYSINLSNRTRITHRSYSENTTYASARAKFYIRWLPMSLLKVHEIGMEYNVRQGKFEEPKVE